MKKRSEFWRAAADTTGAEASSARHSTSHSASESLTEPIAELCSPASGVLGAHTRSSTSRHLSTLLQHCAQPLHCVLHSDCSEPPATGDAVVSTHSVAKQSSSSAAHATSFEP